MTGSTKSLTFRKGYTTTKKCLPLCMGFWCEPAESTGESIEIRSLGVCKFPIFFLHRRCLHPLFVRPPCLTWGLTHPKSRVYRACKPCVSSEFPFDGAMFRRGHILFALPIVAGILLFEKK